MNSEAINYLNSIFGIQLDNQNWISYDANNNQIIIEEVSGETQEWKVENIQQAINGNQGDTRKTLIRLKNLLN